MRTLVLGVVLAGLTGLASPARACMNDVESSRHEREFRSDYGDESSEVVPTPTYPMARWTNPALYGGGAALLAGAFFLVGFRRAKG